MTSHTASAVPFVDDDFLVQQRAELSARRTAYLEQVARLAAAVDELANTAAAAAAGFRPCRHCRPGVG